MENTERKEHNPFEEKKVALPKCDHSYDMMIETERGHVLMCSKCGDCKTCSCEGCLWQ